MLSIGPIALGRRRSSPGVSSAIADREASLVNGDENLSDIERMGGCGAYAFLCVCPCTRTLHEHLYVCACALVMRDVYWHTRVCASVH